MSLLKSTNKVELLIVNNETGKHHGEIFDVSSLAHNIEYFTSISGQPGKLTFTLERDQNNILRLSIGSLVQFKYNSANVFKGYVFNVKTNRRDTYEVIAYDQTRYLKNKDILMTDNMTSSELFKYICSKIKISSYKIVEDSKYKVPDYLYNNKSYYEMIEDSCMKTLEHYDPSTGRKYYFVRDNFGTLEFTELNKLRTDLIIGSGSLLTDYTYEQDIDSDTYNNVILIKTSSDGKTADISYVEMREEDVDKWGLLTHIETIKENLKTQDQVKDYAQKILDIKSRILQTVTLECLGALGYVIDPDTEERTTGKPVIMSAGMGFYFRLNKLNIKALPMYIESATHHFDGDNYTMSLEVSGLVSDIAEDTTVSLTKKTNLEIAQEVINGDWGVMPLRQKRLEEAGYNYAEIRKLVNSLM